MASHIDNHMNGDSDIVTNGYANGEEIESDQDLNGLDSGDELSSKLRTSNEKRIKRKAKRPSTKVAFVAANNHLITNGGGVQVSPVSADVSLISPVNGVNGFNGVNSAKKLSKNSRRPRGRYGRGLPKKGGAGGRGTWGKPGCELIGVEESPEDPHDPNYDSDSQENCKFEAITPPLDEDEIEKHVSPLISEYYEHGDTEEVALSLEELNLGDSQYKILVIGVSLAMERKASHREMTSVLISDLYGRILHEEDIERGFDILLKSLPDLILDTPTAPTILGNFIARSVADDCIPPKFVQSFSSGSVDCPHIGIAMDHASALLNMKHGLVRLDSVWGVCGGMRPVKYLIRQIQLMLKEYLSSGDIEEASRCLRELEVPHFHHEFVYEAVVMALEDMGERTMDLICSLFKALCSSVILTVDQLKNGFNRVYEEMPEISIDVPLAYQVLEKLVGKCSTVGFLPEELLKSVPLRGRKRFVSEGDGGLVKEDVY